MSLKMKDTVKNRTYPKRPFAWYVEKPSAKDYLLTVFILCDSKNKPPAMQGEGRSLDISNLLC